MTVSSGLFSLPETTIRPDDHELDSIPRPVAWRLHDYPGSVIVERHHHSRAQLLFASRGVMTVETEQGIWVVPPKRAVWIPPGMDHEVTSRGHLLMRSLYFDAGLVKDLPTTCMVVTVSPLFRELSLAAISLPVLYDENGSDGRLIEVLLDQLKTITTTPLHLPTSNDKRLAPIIAGLSRDPSDNRNLAAWATVVGASERTLSRLFYQQTGMTFRQWRQQVKLLEALGRLANGEPVTNVALDLGYDSQSAFIAMFKKALGTTPGKYFANLELQQR
jgi:AraC-like DNA-binding protein